MNFQIICFMQVTISSTGNNIILQVRNMVSSRCTTILVQQVLENTLLLIVPNDASSLEGLKLINLL
ncbi:MAG: hypothetical protein V4643_01560 [Bacteroidota bacterium]